MTAACDLDRVHHAAACATYIHDTRRDQFERRNRVLALTAVGMSAEEVATRVGLSSRQVVRLRSAVPPPEPLQFPAPHHISEQRSDDMESLAAFALTLVGELREENPALVWASLSRLSRQVLRELAVVLLAMVPVDVTRDELLAWVLDLPAAKSEAAQ